MVQQQTRVVLPSHELRTAHNAFCRSTLYLPWWHCSHSFDE